MTPLVAQTELWPIMAVAGLGLIIAMLMLRGQRVRSRQQRDDRSPRVSQVGLDLSRYAGQDRWEVEMHDRSREMSGTLDSKMSALQSLIAEADRAAARLERAIEKHDENGTSPLSGGACPARFTGQPPVAPEEGSPDVDEIHTLADYGHEPSEIASRVGRPVGEVELILRLRGQG